MPNGRGISATSRGPADAGMGYDTARLQRCQLGRVEVVVAGDEGVPMYAIGKRSRLLPVNKASRRKLLEARRPPQGNSFAAVPPVRFRFEMFIANTKARDFSNLVTRTVGPARCEDGHLSAREYRHACGFSVESPHTTQEHLNREVVSVVHDSSAFSAPGSSG